LPQAASITPAATMMAAPRTVRIGAMRIFKVRGVTSR
jgi:hypothetical protein